MSYLEWSGQFSIIPKPELRGFWGDSLALSTHWRWPHPHGAHNKTGMLVPALVPRSCVVGAPAKHIGGHNLWHIRHQRSATVAWPILRLSTIFGWCHGIKSHHEKPCNHLTKISCYKELKSIHNTVAHWISWIYSGRTSNGHVTMCVCLLLGNFKAPARQSKHLFSNCIKHPMGKTKVRMIP